MAARVSVKWTFMWQFKLKHMIIQIKIINFYVSCIQMLIKISNEINMINVYIKALELIFIN